MLTMTKDDYEKILAHCKEGLPNEACGLIGGTKDGGEKHIKKVYLLTNIDESLSLIHIQMCIRDS